MHAHSPAPLVVHSTCVHHLYGSSLGGSATNSASGLPHVSRALQNRFARSSLFQFEKMAGFPPHLMRSILLRSNLGLMKDVPGVSSAIGDDAACCCASIVSTCSQAGGICRSLYVPDQGSPGPAMIQLCRALRRWWTDRYRDVVESGQQQRKMGNARPYQFNRYLVKQCSFRQDSDPSQQTNTSLWC